MLQLYLSWHHRHGLKLHTHHLYESAACHPGVDSNCRSGKHVDHATLDFGSKYSRLLKIYGQCAEARAEAL